MPELSRLTLEIDDKGIVTANGNLDIFKKKSADAAKAATGVGNANKSTAKSFGTLNELTSLHTIAMGASTLAVIKFADSVINAAGKMEMIKTQLRVVTGSAKAADETFRELQEFAARTPFSISGITDTGIQLLNVGVAAEDLKSTLQMLGDAAGGSQEKLNRIMMNYTQILSVGKASTMDIRQFAQANLPIYAELEKVTGKSGEALQNLITTGQITGEVISEAFKSMTSEGGKFYQGMELAADTYQGKLSTMQDSVENLAAKFGDLWLLSFKKKALDAITAVADAAADALDGLTFGKRANDAVFGDPDNASLEQWEYAANLQIAMWFQQVQQWKKLGGENYQESAGYQEAVKNWNAWIDKLDEVTRKEKERTIAEREAKEEAERLAEAARIAAEEAAVWQEVLKKALSLEEVTTGNQAVSDYIENIETEMNGAIAWAQMFGEDVTKVYDDYSEKIKKAIQVLLQSGLWTPDENTVARLHAFYAQVAENGSGEDSTYDKMKSDLEKQIQLFELGTNERKKQLLIQKGLNEGQAEELVGLQRKLELLKNVKDFTVEIQQSLDDQDWSEYAKYYGAQAGLNAIGGTDAGNFAQGFMQGGWQNGLINMVVGAFMKILDDSEGFQRALNLVTEALEPAGEFIGEIMDALEPLMDAAVIGGEIGQSLAEVTLMLEPVIPIIKVISTIIYYVSVVLQKAFGLLGSLTSWIFGDLTSGMNDFADSMYRAKDSVDEQNQAMQELIGQLKELRKQIREDQLYYESRNRNINALQGIQELENVSVQDAIIAPGGKVITTAPDDYLIATKTPGSLAGSGGNVFLTINNEAAGTVSISAESVQRSDGSQEIVATVTKVIANEIAKGGLDNAFDIRQRRLTGVRSS